VDSASRVLAKNPSPTMQQQAQSSVNRATARAIVNVRTVCPSIRLENDKDIPFRDTLEVSDGNGPVDALAKALKKALLPSYPSLRTVELVDYKVRILDPAAATEAVTRVLIEFRDTATESKWTTVSADANVISASLNALIDGYEFALIEHAESCMLCDDFFS
jgi:2-isopropylmalate synthase